MYKVATPRGNVRKNLRKKQKKSEIQMQKSKFDKISGALWENTYVGIMLHREQNSMFHKTIFRYFCFTLMSRDKRKRALMYFTRWRTSHCRCDKIRTAQQRSTRRTMLVQGGLAKRPDTARSENNWPKEGSSMSKNCQRKVINRWEYENWKAGGLQRCLAKSPHQSTRTGSSWCRPCASDWSDIETKRLSSS